MAASFPPWLGMTQETSTDWSSGVVRYGLYELEQGLYWVLQGCYNFISGLNNVKAYLGGCFSLETLKPQPCDRGDTIEVGCRNSLVRRIPVKGPRVLRGEVEGN